MSITKAEMQEVLREFARDLRPAGNFGGGTAPSGGGAVGAVQAVGGAGINLLGEAAKQGADAVKKLATNSFSAADAIDSVGKTIGSVMPGFGSQFTAIAGQVNTANERIKVFGQSGVDMAGDLGKFNKAVVDSGVDQERLNKLIRESGTSYSGVGLTMNSAASNVLGFARDLQTVPFIEKMKAAGTTQAEVAELAMISLKERRGIDLNDKKARDEMLENTVKLSGEMNEVARLTGVSRDEQMKKLAKDKENVMVQAELMGMDKDATSRYDLLKTTLGPLGETVSKVTDEIFTGGIRTQEGANRMAALGPAGRQLEEAILLQKNAVTAEQKTRAEAAMNEAKSAVARYQQSEAFLAQVKTDKSAVGDAAREMMAQNAELKGRATAAATAGGVGLPPGQAPISEAAQQQSRLDAAKRDTLRQTAGGQPIEGAGVSTALNQIQERIYQESKVAAGLLRDLNNTAGQQLIASKRANELLSPRVPGATPGSEPVRRELSPTGTMMGEGQEAVRGILQRLDQTGQRGSSANISEEDRRRLGGTPRAEGGPVEPGEPYWVGEEGPEIVTFEQAGEVIPTDKVADIGKESKKKTPFSDMNNMFSGMQERLQSQLPDFSAMFNSMTVDIPDIGNIFAEKFPEMTEIESLMPDMSNLFTASLPKIPELESLMPDMSNLFTASLPKTEDLEQAMPDFDVLTSELASISPASFENINPPTNDNVAENSTFNIDYDAFGTEISKSMAPTNTQTAEEKENMMTRALPEETSGATLNDLKDQLVQLNTNILELIAHSATSAENTGMAVRATRDLNGNLFA